MTLPRDIRIHQIYYRPHHRLFLDRRFTPYDNRRNPRPDLAEQYIFRKEFDSKALFDAPLVGFVSWKFGLKSGVPGGRFIDFIARNPGYDVYFINPFPILACRWKNVWQQGEAKHPGLSAFAQRMFADLGLDWDVSAMVNDQTTAAYCNYWVGSAEFWTIYLTHAAAVLDYIEHGCTEEQRAFVYSQAGDRHRGHHVPYILERLFSTLLYHSPEIRHRAYHYRDAELTAKYGRLAGAVRSANDLKSRVAAPDAPLPPDSFHEQLAGLLAERQVRDRRRPLSCLKRRLRFY